MEHNNFISVDDKMLYQRGPNPSLRGMKTQFENDFSISNKIINNDNEVYKKYNVIPNAGLSYDIVNRPFKLIVHLDQATVGADGVGTIILNEPFKDIVSVKLLNGIFMEAAPADGSDTGVASYGAPLFITLSISELNNIYGTSSGGSLLNSFATLDYDKTYDRDTRSTHPVLGSSTAKGRVNIYKNNYGVNRDIRYFDPPLHLLSQLNISLFDDNGTTKLFDDVVSGDTFKCNLEFLIETKEKMRLY